MIRSALFILSGNTAASVLLFLRNLLIARLIPVAEYGVASTFILVMAIVEMMSALGLQQQLVQARRGDDPHFQAALQGFQLLRGTVSALALFAMAGPIADFLRVPEAAPFYRLLALVPFINALQHFDIYRLNRSLLFWPGLLSSTVTALVALLLVWPLDRWFNDARVMLYSIIAQVGLMVVMSHLLARRPWRLAFDRAVMAGSLRFGWPLLIDGMQLFIVFNGDRMIVGRELGMEMLALFSMGITLTLTPSLIYDRSAQSFFLPQLAALGREGAAGGARFRHLALVSLQASTAFGGLLALAFLLLGPGFVDLALGSDFGPLGPLLALLVLVQALRVIKGGGATVALAVGHTANSMIANLARIALLPVAWLVVTLTGSVVLVILLAIVGELIGMGLSYGLVRWRVGLPLRSMLAPVAAVLALFALIGLAGVLTGPAIGLPVALVRGLACGLYLLCLALMTDLRAYLLAALRRR